MQCCGIQPFLTRSLSSNNPLHLPGRLQTRHKCSRGPTKQFRFGVDGRLCTPNFGGVSSARPTNQVEVISRSASWRESQSMWNLTWNRQDRRRLSFIWRPLTHSQLLACCRWAKLEKTPTFGNGVRGDRPGLKVPASTSKSSRRKRVEKLAIYSARSAAADA